MFRFVLIGLIVLIAFPGGLAANDKILSVLNWSEYLDDDLVAEFERRYEVDVQFTYFESSDDRDRIMAENDGAGFDLVLAEDASIRALSLLGWLQPFDEREVPNLRHLDPRWLARDEQGRVLAVPYFWGTVGIAYRRDLLEQPISTWRQFFEPAEDLRGYIALIDDAWDVVGMALKSLGKSMVSESSQDLSEAESLLRAQKPYVRSYGVVSLTEKSTLNTGEIRAAMVYNGDGVTLAELNENIAYVLPEEGSGLWVDQWTVPAKATSKPLAYRFLDFLNEPKNAAKNAETLYYASPNRDAEALMSADLLHDPNVYPPAEVLARCERYQGLSARALRRRISILSSLTGD